MELRHYKTNLEAEAMKHKQQLREQSNNIATRKTYMDLGQAA
jgi:hypothetical protein